MKRSVAFLGLVAALTLMSFLPQSNAFASIRGASVRPAVSSVLCPPPCRRSECQQQCSFYGKAAFCDVDPNGCTYCACLG